MFATLHSASTRRRILGVAVAGGLGLAIFIGAAPHGRGSVMSNLLDMAPRAVQMHDGRDLFVQRYEVTIAEWNACFADRGCFINLRERPDQDAGSTPATGLSYLDVQDYVTWINAKTDNDFRLPTAKEWAFMAEPVLPDEPDQIFTDPELTWASSYLTDEQPPRTLRPQGSFSTTPEGIEDLDGSVWEWTSDCYNDSINDDRCPAFYVGGEHIAAMSYLIRDPARGGCAVGSPPAHLGFRLVSDKHP